MIFFIIVSSAIFLRYLGLSLLVDKLVHNSSYEKIFVFKRARNQKTKEVTLSFISSVIFGLGFYIFFRLWELGVIKFITNEYPLWYHPISIVTALLLHETYYYWLHRLMHTRKLYRYLHKGHHNSIEVSSWTSFAFDPLESVLQVLPLYLMVSLIPLHLYSVIFLLLFMSVSAAINHLNYEIYPKFFKVIFPFNILIGATHHALHHKEFKTNYGLYFTFWDRWMGTESKNYK